MEGDDRPFSELRKDLQECKSAMLALSSRLTTLEGFEQRLKHLEARQIEISQMLEERDQH